MSAKKYNFLIYVLGIAIILSSCGKENEQVDYNVGVLASQEYVQSQQMMNLLLNTYFKSITDSLLIVDHHSEIDGAVVVYSETPEEKIVMDYPDWGCIDDCGHYRAGTITAKPNTGFYDSLAVISFTFEDFRYDFDEISVTGMTLTNLGRLDDVHYSYKIIIPNVQRKYADTSGATEFNMDQTFKLLKDPTTIFHSPKDYFKISGIIKGTTSSNVSYMASINEQEYLINQYSCRWTKQGPAILSFESETYEAFILFPGADTCLNKYGVGIDGNPFFYPFD
jgi:hypothetical protein